MPAAPESFRPGSSPWWTGGSWLAIMGFLLSRGAALGVGAALAALPLALAVGVLCWHVFYRPHVAVGADGVTVVNPLRTVAVPWAALVEVRTQYALTLVTPHAVVRAWAAPGPGRHQVLAADREELTTLPRTTFDARGAVSIGDLAGSPSGRAAAVVRRHWQRLVEESAIELGVADETVVTTAWNVPAIVALAAAVAAAVALALL